MIYNKIILVVCTIFVVSDAAFVDTIGKCSLKDEQCMKKTFQKVVKSIGDDGIPELGMPSIDPMVLKDVKISIPDIVDVTLIEGKLKGLKNCQLSKFMVDLEEGKGSQETICNIAVDGKYKLFSDGAVIKKLFGGSSIHGEGNGKIEIEKVRISFDFPFSAFKKDDGEIYVKIDHEKIKYDVDVLGSVQLSADKLYLGDKEASKLIVDLMNENWKTVMSSYGSHFIDKAMEVYFDYIGKFLDTVPAKHFISDDLTPYVNN